MLSRLPVEIVAAILFLSGPLAAQNRETLISSILEDPAWSLEAETIEYTDDDVETLVGTKLSSVLDYGFIGASQATLTSDEGSVEVTLYEMTDSPAAYGLFALERDWQRRDFESAVVGAESYRTNDTLVLWQSNYVVGLDGSPQDTDALGKTIADNLFGRSRKASVSLLLPADGRVPESEQYILTSSAFETLTGLDPSELGFDNSVEVALATYTQPGGSGRLAIFLYPTQQVARKHSEAWLASFEGDLPNGRSGPLFAILIESDSEELSESIMSALSYQSEVTWTETLPDPLTLPQMILTIFKGIGVALAFTLTIGLVFGGFRSYMKIHYPGLVFRGMDEVEFVQLKLNQPFTRKELNPGPAETPQPE
jgi:hypothetical protein